MKFNELVFLSFRFMINLVYRWPSTSNSHYNIIFSQLFFLYIYPVNFFSCVSTYTELFFLYALLTRPLCFHEIAPVFIKTSDSKRENIDYSSKLWFLVFLSHNKMYSKQNLKLIFILQPLLVGSEINTTLKETLINITVT